MYSSVPPRRPSASLPLFTAMSMLVVKQSGAIPMPKDKDDRDDKKKPPKKSPVKVVSPPQGESAKGKPVFKVGDGAKEKDKEEKDKGKNDGKEKDEDDEGARGRSRKVPDERTIALPVIVRPPSESGAVDSGSSNNPSESSPSSPSSTTSVSSIEPTETITAPIAFYAYEEGIVQDGSQVYEGVWVPSTRSGPSGEYGCVLWVQEGHEPTSFWRPQCADPTLTWWAWVIIVVGVLLVIMSCFKCSKSVAWFRSKVGAVTLPSKPSRPAGQAAMVAAPARQWKR